LWVINLAASISTSGTRRATTWMPDTCTSIWIPGAGATFDRVLETARVVHEALDTLKMPSVVKTTGSKGLHIYVRSCAARWQKQVLDVREALAAGARRPSIRGLITAEYRVASRPRGRVLVRLQPERWAARSRPVYSPRPRPTPPSRRRVTWKEVDRGSRIEDFTVKNVPASRGQRLATCGNRCSASAGASSCRSTCR